MRACSPTTICENPLNMRTENCRCTILFPHALLSFVHTFVKGCNRQGVLTTIDMGILSWFATEQANLIFQKHCYCLLHGFFKYKHTYYLYWPSFWGEPEVLEDVLYVRSLCVFEDGCLTFLAVDG